MKISLIFIIALSIFVYGCGLSKTRFAKVQIEGQKDWYSQSEQIDKYLLDTFTSSKENNVLTYPPEQFCRNVYIAIDVTKSGFENSIQFNGSEISWNEYNIRKFVRYLGERKVLRLGDNIKLRVFGSKPNHTNSPLNIKNIPQDESTDIEIPRGSVKFNSTILTSRYNDLLIEVGEVNMPQQFDVTVSDQILNWSLEKIKNPQYNKSYLFNFISSLVSEAKQNNKPESLLIFVTDGHIDFGDKYFSPTQFSPQLIEKIKEEVETIRIRPFLDKINNGTKMSIIFHGLQSNGNTRFKNSQDEFLKWFLEGLSNENLTLIHLGDN